MLEGSGHFLSHLDGFRLPISGRDIGVLSEVNGGAKALTQAPLGSQLCLEPITPSLSRLMGQGIHFGVL